MGVCPLPRDMAKHVDRMEVKQLMLMQKHAEVTKGSSITKGKSVLCQIYRMYILTFSIVK